MKDFKKVIPKITSLDFIQALDKAVTMMQDERRFGCIVGGKITGGFMELRIPENLVIIGDLHGDLKSFFEILQSIDFEYFLANSNNKIIFLGDYVDRGTNSIGILYVLCNLKYEYPNSVILMRGNHESPAEFPFCSHNLPIEIVKLFGAKTGKLIYDKKILPFFKLLVLVTLIKGRLIIVHGGLPVNFSEPTIRDFKQIFAASAENYLRNTVMEEILWNDPRENIRNNLYWENSKRGFGKYFGINISRKWLKICGSKAIIRGHEPCQGFKIDHHGAVMTLFSCKEGYPSYEPAYIMISSDKLRNIHNAIDLSQNVVKL
jgi:protein phosphatase